MDSNTIYFIVVLALIFLTFYIISYFLDKTEGKYTLRNQFLTAAEQNFYKQLKNTYGSEYIIMSKVRLIDIVKPLELQRNYQSSKNKVIQKHVDFLLIDPTTFKPVLVYELDDKSHKKLETKLRDETKDVILNSVGIEVVRLPVSNNYHFEAITKPQTQFRSNL